MLGCLLPAFALLCSPYRDVISRPLRMPPYWQLHICYWCSPSVAARDRSLWDVAAAIMFSARLSGLEVLNRGFLEWAHCEGEEWKWKTGRRAEREQGLQQPQVEMEERYFDWQLSGLVPAEVVPPVDCYYQQKDFPIALAGTVSPLSPGGCYPIWEEMNRGPLAPYEVCVDRIFTEGAQWSKQA